MNSRETVNPNARPDGTVADGEGGNASDEQDTAKGGNEVREIGGRKGPDPTRYGDWEKAGRCIDF